MKVLVFNCGSSSIKYQLFEMPDGKILAKGMIQRIGEGLSTAHQKPETIKAEMNPEEVLLSIVKELDSQKLTYSSNPADLRDCSGIFLRVLEALQKQCSQIKGPNKKFARSSRTIAAWYAEHNRLKLIQDILKQDNLIKPGTVMFYGHQNIKYQNLTHEKVLKEIGHIGIVVSVKSDEKGKVISYELFHGRSGLKPASITNFHKRKPSRSNFPSLGNGSQQCIAVAMLLMDSYVNE